MTPVHDSSPQSSKSGVGIASQQYASKVKMLIALMTDLRAIGAQTEIDLPRIAVIGNQSAGKSSLVEAITGISVPRAAGTCTRCPMECRMTNSKSEWRAQVSIRKERDENGNKLEEIREEKFGPVIDDKTDLEEILRLAQFAILNPSLPASYFEGLDADDFQAQGPPEGSPSQLQFSPNIVCVDIAGPNLTDLSFIDLPGIISNVADGEDRNNIELVKSLVKDHIEGNALILLTITMRDDIENQSAAFLAKEADPQGLRTIGVLTKPDLLQPGEEQLWFNILKGRKHQLHHGYFVTKQPAILELEEKLEHHEARKREREFFNNKPPWNMMLSSLRDRVGVPNLTTELSRLLSQLIEKMLPKLRADTQSAYSQTSQHLRDLPTPPSENPTAELLRLVNAFTTHLNNFIDGSEAYSGLIQECRPAYKQFRSDIVSTRPNFLPYDDPNACPSEDTNAEPIEYSDAEAQPDPSRRRPPMYLNEVRQYVEKSLARQLPFNLPFVAKVGLIEQHFDDWPSHAIQCFDSVRTVFVRQVSELIMQHFGRHAIGGLKDQVRMIVENQIDEAANTTKNHIDWLFELEKPPFTLNEHYFSSYREKYITKFKKLRRGTDSQFSDTDASTALSELAKLHFDNLTADDLHALRTDPYDQEIVIMAEVHAYFQVAYKRIIDNVPRVIDLDFLRAVGSKMQNALIQELGISDENAVQRATAYLSEDAHLTAERDALKQTKRRLEEIKNRLFKFHV